MMLSRGKDLSDMIQEISVLEQSTQVYDVVISNEYGGDKGTTRFNKDNNTVEMVLPEDNNLEIAGHEFKHGYQFEIGKYGFTKMSSQIPIYDHTDEIEAYNRSASITGLDYSDILNGETYAHLNRNPYSVRTLLEPIKEYLNNELVIERFARQKKTIFRWNGRTYIGF